MDGGGPPIEGAAVVEQIGAQIPADLVLRDQRGDPFRLGDLLGGPPVLLTMAWYHCHTLCGMVLDGTARALAGAGLAPGRDVRLATVSIDPRDDAESAAARRAGVSAALGAPLAAGAWPFLFGDADAVRKLADVVGFGFRWDAHSEQYAHAAVLVALTPEGRVSSYLYGVAFDPVALTRAVQRAGAGGTQASSEPLLLRCFHYVSALNRWAAPIRSYLRAGGALSLLALGIGGGLAVRARRRAESLR